MTEARRLVSDCFIKWPPLPHSPGKSVYIFNTELAQKGSNMESTRKVRVAKVSVKAVTYQPVRLKQGTFKKLQKILEAVNKKDFGSRIRSDTVIDAALSLLCTNEIEAMRQGSMSNADRLERMYRAHVADEGAMSKDAFLGLVLSGQLPLDAATTAVAAPDDVAQAN